MATASNERWYWDLDKEQAVPAAERGKGDNTLGPYDSRAEALNWRTKVDDRNDAWDDADDDWNDTESSDADE